MTFAINHRAGINRRMMRHQLRLRLRPKAPPESSQPRPPLSKCGHYECAERGTPGRQHDNQDKRVGKARGLFHNAEEKQQLPQAIQSTGNQEEEQRVARVKGLGLVSYCLTVRGSILSVSQRGPREVGIRARRFTLALARAWSRSAFQR